MTPVGVYSKTRGYASSTIRTYLSPFETSHDDGAPIFAINVSAPGAVPPYEEQFEGWYSTTNWVGNGLAFHPLSTRFGIQNIMDGTAQTIMLAERYQVCGKPGAEVPTLWGMGAYSATTASFALSPPREPYPKSTDAQYALKQLVPPVKVDADTNVPAAFQFLPKREECDSTILQTMNPAGMIVCMFDGSTRTLNPKIKPTTFWAAVTPAGNEDLGADW